MSCPNCGHQGRLLKKGRYKTYSSLNDLNYFLFAKEKYGLLWLIGAEGYRYYSEEDTDPTPKLTTVSVYAFRPGESANWVWKWDGWNRRKRMGKPFTGHQVFSPPTSYYFLGAEEIAKSEMKYCGMAEAWLELVGHDIFEDATTALVDRVETYMDLYSRYPAVEMLVKLGHADVVGDVLRGYGMGAWKWKAKTPWDFFRVSRAEYKAFAKTGLDIKDLKEKAGIMPKEGLEEYIRLKGIWGYHLRDAYKAYHEKRYWNKLCTWYPGHNWVTWQDALRMEAFVGNNIEHEDVLMPKDLDARHDELVVLEQRERERQKMQEEETARTYYKKRRRELERKYAYSDGVMSIIVPENEKEIEAEGAALKHCVAGYADRHIRGVKTILFLRWADDIHTPYVTIEVDSFGEIVQIHGWRNEVSGLTAKPREIHGEFLDEWLAWIQAGSRRDKQGNPIRNKEAA